MSLLQSPRIGILGGGQLGAMMLRAAIDLGLEVSVMDADPQAPCSRYSGHFQQGSLLDPDAVVAFGKSLDVVTIEIEAVSTAGLRQLREQGVRVCPSPDVIEMIQDKWAQKQFLLRHGIPVVPGQLLEHPRDGAHTPATGCLKLCRGGYDGKGVMMMRTPSDWASAFEQPSVLEELVEIEKEVAIIVARDAGGEIRTYDLVEMVADPVLHLLDYQLCPARAGEAHRQEADRLARAIAEACDLVGILAVECFITTSGTLLVNELAPRAHNSGHHTIEATPCGQFEQLLRIAGGLPMGDTRTTSPSAMVNILAPEAGNLSRLDAGLKALLGDPGVRVHWYGKAPSKAGRKLGHATILAATEAEAIAGAQAARARTRF